MPLLIFIVVLTGLAIAIMVHFVHMAIMCLRNWPNTKILTYEFLLDRIFSGIIGALLGLLLLSFA